MLGIGLHIALYTLLYLSSEECVVPTTLLSSRGPRSCWKQWLTQRLEVPLYARKPVHRTPIITECFPSSCAWAKRSCTVGDSRPSCEGVSQSAVVKVQSVELQVESNAHRDKDDVYYSFKNKKAAFLSLSAEMTAYTEKLLLWLFIPCNACRLLE